MASNTTSKAGPPRAGGNALHMPVLLEECVNLLGPALTAEAPVMTDATLGMGGHSFAFLERFANLTVVGIDRDPEAIELAGERLAPFGKRFVPVRATYDDVFDVAAEYGRAGRADAVLMDLGVSSLQLDDEDRGFSYSGDGPLDMRMDKTGGPTAADVLASADKVELTRILREYGEERFASRIAARILAARAEEPIERTGQLADIVRDAIPAPARRTGGNPCKRTFQARFESPSTTSLPSSGAPSRAPSRRLRLEAASPSSRTNRWRTGSSSVRWRKGRRPRRRRACPSNSTTAPRTSACLPAAPSKPTPRSCRPIRAAHRCASGPPRGCAKPRTPHKPATTRGKNR